MKPTSISCQFSVLTMYILFRFTKKQLKLSYFRSRAQVFMNEVAFWIISLIFSDCYNFHFSCVKLWISNPRQHWSWNWLALSAQFDVSHDYSPNKIYQWMKNGPKSLTRAGNILSTFLREFRSPRQSIPHTQDISVLIDLIKHGRRVSFKLLFMLAMMRVEH